MNYRIKSSQNIFKSNIHTWRIIFFHQPPIVSFFLISLWNNPHAGFCWFCRSSSGVDSDVNSHTRSCGHFTGTKIKIKTKQQTEGGRKKQTAKPRKVKLALFSILCMFMAIARTLQKSHPAIKNADSFGHCPNFPTPFFGVSLPTDCLGVSLLADWRLSSFSSGLAEFSRAQLFEWSSRQNRPRKVFWTLWRHFKDIEDDFTGHHNTQRPTHTSIYIYIIY